MFTTHVVPLRASLFCTCLLLLLLCGCGGGSSSSTSADNGPVTSSPRTSNNLQFTLTTNKAVYARGETVQCAFAVKNVGTQSVSTNSGEGFYQFSVYQGSSLVGPNPQGHATIAYPVDVCARRNKNIHDGVGSA